MAEDPGYPPSWDEIVPDPSKRDHRAEWAARRDRVAVTAKLLRAELYARLGNECALCRSDEDLSLDHYPERRTWKLRDKNQLQRMRLYLRDFAAGNLRLLCVSCNSAWQHWWRKREKKQ